MAGKSRSADIHRQLNYPVIDTDGHWIEFEPTLLEHLNGVAGPTMVDRFRREDYCGRIARAPASSPSRLSVRKFPFSCLLLTYGTAHDRPRDWDRVDKPRSKVS
jgi:hypothetical protein